MNKLSFTIYVTTKCNMKCTYCYEKEYISIDMPFDVANKVVYFINKKILEQDSNFVNVKFHGGEPLLAFPLIKYFIDELDKIQKERGVNFIYSATINGTLFDDEMIPILKRFDELSVSIDGDKEIHNLNRMLPSKQGTYDIVSININKLLYFHPNITGRMTITPSTYKCVFDSFLHIVGMGFKRIELELDFTDESWTEDIIAEYMNELKRIADKIYESSHAGVIINMPLLEYVKGKPKNSICDGGKYSFTIAPNGKVYPCIFTIHKEEFLLGYVDEPFDENVLIKIIENGKLENESCIGCARYNYCKTTRCKLINYVCTGNYFTPSPIMCANENINVTIGKYFAELMLK